MEPCATGDLCFTCGKVWKSLTGSQYDLPGEAIGDFHDEVQEVLQIGWVDQLAATKILRSLPVLLGASYQKGWHTHRDVHCPRDTFSMREHSRVPDGVHCSTTGDLLYLELSTENGIVEKDLLPSIADSMAIVARLGGQCLWTDRLCIYQDSAMDKIAQLHQMDSMYRQFAITMIVAGPFDQLRDPGLPARLSVY